MNLENVTPEIIVEKFNKFLNRIICDMIREHRQTGQYVVSKINLQGRPTNLYEVKLFLDALKVLLPSEESIINMDWYFKIKRDFRRWENIIETLTIDDYKSLTIEDIANLMVENKDKIEELLEILGII